MSLDLQIMPIFLPELHLQVLVFGVMRQKQKNFKTKQKTLQILLETIVMKIRTILHVHKFYHLQQQVE